MKSTMLQYDGSVEEAVERLLEIGVFKSKADIFRIGAMELASKYGLVKSKEEVIEEMMFGDAETALRRVRSGKAKLHAISRV
ncbi:Uncharacterised protein [uncultured archaeon]|nr:Uncharacterised protein [uncultured archaeon]